VLEPVAAEELEQGFLPFRAHPEPPEHAALVVLVGDADPRLISSAAGPISRRSRAAISSAALLVNVTAQIRLGESPSWAMRCPIRAIRQYVLPAPGPATTSTGPRGAWMARRWASDGVRVRRRLSVSRRG
jgi:hypothetical protein